MPPTTQFFIEKGVQIAVGVIAYFAYRSSKSNDHKIAEVGTRLDGRLDELLKVTKEQAITEGIETGRKQVKDEHKKATRKSK